MKRRICESCFFYEEAGIVNSGWCRHPDRQFTTGVRLVVRGSELNCRNGWDVDLWVPAGIEPGKPDETKDVWSNADQQDDQLTSIVPARYDSPESPAPYRPETDDVVVRHAPYHDYTQPEKDARDLVTNPRAAILRAREQFKVRQLREGRIADHRIEHPPLIDATDDTPGTAMNGNLNRQRGDADDSRPENAPFLGEGAGSTRRVPEYSVPPVTRDEMKRPFETITHFAEDDQRFESIPDEFTNIPAPQEERLIPELTIELDDRPQLHDDAFDDWFDDQLIAENGRLAHPPKRRRESFVDRLLRERRQKRLHEAEDQEPAMEHFSEFPADEPGEIHEDFEPLSPQARYPDHAHRQQYFEHASEPAVQANAESLVRNPAANSRHPMPEPSPDEPEWLMAPFDEPEFVYRRGAEEQYPSRRQTTTTDDLPQWNTLGSQYREPQHPEPPERAVRPLAPDLPQLCRTCRDFRPAESGDRGWCNNPWAFRHRRMVDADILSCESSFGHWWLPHDGVWQKAGDVSRHAQETPLLDRLLGIDDYSELPPPGSAAGRGR